MLSGTVRFCAQQMEKYKKICPNFISHKHRRPVGKIYSSDNPQFPAIF